MLSLARSVTGEMEASFWLESEGKSFDLCMTTKTVMDQEKRYQLISSATSRKNEAANSFLGKLRDSFEQAMLAEAESMNEVPDDAINDVYNRFIDETEWDQYEQSILSRLADNVKIAIKGKTVKFKLNGKTYKAKTNSKGIAKVNIKLNSLPKGKIKYQASYHKNTVKRTIRI